jgi:hypothetical protein
LGKMCVADRKECARGPYRQIHHRAFDQLFHIEVSPVARSRSIRTSWSSAGATPITPGKEASGIRTRG